MKNAKTHQRTVKGRSASYYEQQREKGTHLVPTGHSRLMPNVEIALPSVVIESITTTTKMRRIARTRDAAISFVSNGTIGRRNISYVAAD